MSKSRYTNAKIITSRTGKKLYSMHSMAKKIDITKLSLMPVQVTETTRLDILANKYLGNGKYWWVLAYVNNLYWPWNIEPGTTLLVPTNVENILDYF